MSANKAVQQLLGLIIITLALTGCGRELSDFTVETGPTVTETQTVQSLGALSADAEVKLGVGKLTITGGSNDLMTGTFTYNVPTWKPEISYALDGTHGVLNLEQPRSVASTIPNSAQVEYTWDLLFSNWMPLAIDADLGVGEGVLNLRGLNLTELNVTTGVGSSTIDLGGNWNQSFDVRIERGLGKTTLIVPTKVGVEIRPQTGVGNVRVYGLVQDGEDYHNSQYGISPVTIEIEILGGFGATEIRLDQ